MENETYLKTIKVEVVLPANDSLHNVFNDKEYEVTFIEKETETKVILEKL